MITVFFPPFSPSLSPCSYWLLLLDLDQLLLGAVLFTLLSFLFPTIAVFYLCILSIFLYHYMASFVMLELTLEFIFEFPFYHMLLYPFSPPLPSNGLFLTPYVHQRHPIDQPQTFMHLKPSPISFNRIFDSFFDRFWLLLSHYLSFNSFSTLMTGRVLLPFTKK